MINFWAALAALMALMAPREGWVDFGGRGGRRVVDLEFQFENLGIPSPSMEFLCSWYLELNEKLVELN
jgi:hypothetical protein